MTKIEKTLVVSTLALSVYSLWRSLPLISHIEAEVIYRIIIPNMLISVFGIAGSISMWKGLSFSAHLLFGVWFLSIVSGIGMSDTPVGAGLFIDIVSIVSVAPIFLLIYYTFFNNRVNDGKSKD